MGGSLPKTPREYTPTLPFIFLLLKTKKKSLGFNPGDFVKGENGLFNPFIEFLLYCSGNFAFPCSCIAQEVRNDHVSRFGNVDVIHCLKH